MGKNGVLNFCVVLALLSLLPSFGFAQNLRPAWIFFTTKGEVTEGALPSLHAIARRAAKGQPGTEYLDLPVSKKFRRTLSDIGVKIRVVSRWLNAVSVVADPELLTQIRRFPFVLRIEEVGCGCRMPEEVLRFRTFATSPKFKIRDEKKSTDSFVLENYGPSWNQVSQLSVPDLHTRGLTGKGVRIAILDSGFQKDHEAFALILKERRVIAEKDFIDPSTSVAADEHGTMTWSVLAGYRPGQMIGPAHGAQFLLARTEDRRMELPIEEDHWIAGLEWAEAQGADIVSSSLGYSRFDDGTFHLYKTLNGRVVLTSIAAHHAMERGVLVVNSVGNNGFEGKQSLHSPADSFGILSVGAVDASGYLAEFSSRGPTADGRIKPEVVAQGVGTYVALSDGYGNASGTSFSTPLIAGLAALLLEAHPEWTPDHLRKALISSASHRKNPDPEFGYGFGLVNGPAAIQGGELYAANP